MKAKLMVSKEREDCCLTPIKDKSSLPKPDKYGNRFEGRWRKKPLVERHRPLKDQTQKNTPHVLEETGLWGVKTTKMLHFNTKSHLVITLSLALFICGSSQLPREPLQASYFHFTSFIHTIAQSSAVCCTRSYWRGTAQLWTIFH